MTTRRSLSAGARVCAMDERAVNEDGSGRLTILLTYVLGITAGAIMAVAI